MEGEEHEDVDFQSGPPPHPPSLDSAPDVLVTQQSLQASRTVSVQSRPISVKRVPRASRAGLLARFSLLYEAEEPKHYPRKIKWTITFIISLAAVAAPMGSSLILREQNHSFCSSGSNLLM